MYGGVTDGVLVLRFAVSLFSNVQPGHRKIHGSRITRQRLKLPLCQNPLAFLEELPLNEKCCQFKIYNFLVFNGVTET